MNRKDMIEKIARAIIKAGDKESKGNPYIELAEAALNALLDELPEEDNEWHAVDILHELKNMKKDNV